MLPLFFLLCVSCTSVGYYRDVIGGHFDILRKAEPIDDVISRETTPTGLKTVLLNVKMAREFATRELLLPDNGSYHRYADIGREYVTWNVIATGEFSVDPKQWCFPIIGCLCYKGFFNPEDAKFFAAELGARGFDTCVYGAVAYSTLGWFDDPVLSTMLTGSEAHYIGVLFHELAHQKLYIANDTAFNEAFATCVAEEGIRRWFAANGKSDARREFQASRQQTLEFNALLLKTRAKLETLYSQKIGPDLMRGHKKEIFDRLRRDYRELKERWGGDTRFDAWMSQKLNNAHLALVATYNDLVSIFRLMLIQSNGDLKSFYHRVAVISSQPREKRHKVLRMIHARKDNWTPLPVSLAP